VVLIREMKNTENEVALSNKSPVCREDSEQNVPYRKPALRSDAFARALIEQKRGLKRFRNSASAFQRRSEEGSGSAEGAVQRILGLSQTMLRLVAPTHRGEYDQILTTPLSVDRCALIT